MVIGSFLENGFEANLSSKTNVLSVCKGRFSGFCIFLSDEVETVFWESKADPSKSFKFKVGHRKLFRKLFWTDFEIKSECSKRLKMIFFRFLQIFEWRSRNRLLGKGRQILQDNLNSKLVIGSFIENDFEATLSSQTNVLSVWQGHFSIFCKVLSDEVETVFWESEAKHEQLFKSKFGHRKLLRKWFWSYLELKNECSERLKRAFFGFLQIFEWLSWNHFLRKWDKTSKTV